MSNDIVQLDPEKSVRDMAHDAWFRGRPEQAVQLIDSLQVKQPADLATAIKCLLILDQKTKAVHAADALLALPTADLTCTLHAARQFNIHLTFEGSLSEPYRSRVYRLLLTGLKEPERLVPEELRWLAQAAGHEQDPKSRLEILDLAAQHDPDDLGLAVEFASRLVVDGQLERAEQILEPALLVDHPEAMVVLLQILAAHRAAAASAGDEALVAELTEQITQLTYHPNFPERDAPIVMLAVAVQYQSWAEANAIMERLHDVGDVAIFNLLASAVHFATERPDSGFEHLEVFLEAYLHDQPESLDRICYSLVSAPHRVIDLSGIARNSLKLARRRAGWRFDSMSDRARSRLELFLARLGVVEASAPDVTDDHPALLRERLDDRSRAQSLLAFAEDLVKICRWSEIHDHSLPTLDFDDPRWRNLLSGSADFRQTHAFLMGEEAQTLAPATRAYIYRQMWRPCIRHAGAWASGLEFLEDLNWVITSEDLLLDRAEYAIELNRADQARWALDKLKTVVSPSPRQQLLERRLAEIVE